MNRVALIADLHGNLPALEALEQDLNRRGIREIWCLGDIVGKGPSSPETFDWAMAHCSVVLRGNWDEGIGRKLFPADQFYYDQLGPERMKKLIELPQEHHTMIGHRKIRLLHGRPIMPSLVSAHDPIDKLMWLFRPDFDIVGYADIHHPELRPFRDGKIIFSIGSVGNSLSSLPCVQYSILNWEENGAADITYCFVPYDNARAVRDAEAVELPRRDAWIQEVTTGVYGRAKKQS